MIKMNENLKHLMSYIPHGLPAKLSDVGRFNIDSEFSSPPEAYELMKITDINLYKDGSVSGIIENKKGYGFDFDGLEEIDFYLRPISDLLKEIEIDGVKMIPIEHMFLPFGEREILTKWAIENKCWIGVPISYLVYDNLFEWGFDVFGLIEKKVVKILN